MCSWKALFGQILSHSSFLCVQLLFCCPTTNFGPLSRGQPHSLDVNHCVSNVFELKVSGSLLMRFVYLTSPRISLPPIPSYSFACPHPVITIKLPLVAVQNHWNVTLYGTCHWYVKRGFLATHKWRPFKVNLSKILKYN